MHGEDAKERQENEFEAGRSLPEHDTEAPQHEPTVVKSAAEAAPTRPASLEPPIGSGPRPRRLGVLLSSCWRERSPRGIRWCLAYRSCSSCSRGCCGGCCDVGRLCPCPRVSECRGVGGPCPRSCAPVVPDSQRRVRKPLRMQVCWVRGRRSSHANQPVDGGVQVAKDLVDLVVTRWGPGAPPSSDRCPPPTKKRSDPAHERVPVETEADGVIEATSSKPQICTILLKAGCPRTLVSEWRPDAVPPSFLVEPVDVLVALILVPWMSVRPSHDPPQPWARQGVP